MAAARQQRETLESSAQHQARAVPLKPLTNRPLWPIHLEDPCYFRKLESALAGLVWSKACFVNQKVKGALT